MFCEHRDCTSTFSQTDSVRKSAKPYRSPACMVMMLRMFWMWATRRTRGRLAVLGTGRIVMRVWPNDLDMNLHMNNGRFFSAADIGRFDWWLRTGLWRKVIARGWRPIAGDANARFSRALKV